MNFDKNIFIYGDNNQGKTNFIESLFVVGNGKSTMNAPLENLVRFNKKEAIIGVDLDTEESDRFYLKISNLGKKQGLLNNNPLRSLKDIQKKLNIEYVSADIIRIFQENAEFRRKDLDNFCIKYNDTYESILRNYERTLKQKNSRLQLNYFIQ